MKKPPAAARIRPARKGEAEIISRILNKYARRKLLLPRTADDILRHISNFCVAVSGGEIVGCCATRSYGRGLFEVRSLAVVPGFTGQGIGSRLVKHCVRRIGRQPGTRIFALTYRADLFRRLGFRDVEKEMFPEKIWSDCSICPKRSRCDEEALLLEI